MSNGPENATVDQLREIAESFGISLSDDHLGEYRLMLEALIGSHRELENYPERKPPVKYARTPGWKPLGKDNVNNAWYWRCDIQGAAKGPLEGERIAIKDHVCVAGVPMMNGSKLLEGFVPDVDAVVVTRLLDAGANIVGKSNCEDLCFSAGGSTCSDGPVTNPYDATRHPGGSSSGSAVLIATGQVDMAIGGDQGGSIRLPASWSGCYGLKPTYGLVPYTGCAAIEATLDHVGPMASTTAGVARMLGVIAGYDVDDPRQQGRIAPGETFDYSVGINRGVKGMRIGILQQGFAHDGTDGNLKSDLRVDECVRNAANVLAGLGAELIDVSVPEHDLGLHLWNVIAVEGAANFMLRDNGVGNNWKGWYNTNLADHFARALRTRAGDLPPTVLATLLRGEYMRRNYGNLYYNKAQNRRHITKDAYDAAFADVDILLCPTIPQVATKIANRDAGPLETVLNLLTSVRNTCVANVTGHPAMSIPCGMIDGLPVGMMITGREFDEATLIAASAAFEATVDWKTLT